MWRPVRVLALLAVVAATAACGGSGGSGGGGDLAAFCRVATEVEAQGGEPTVDQLDRLANDAPEEVRDAVDVVVDYNVAEVAQDADALDAFDDAELGRADEDLRAFVDEECDVDLETATPAAGTPSEEFCGVAVELLSRNDARAEEVRALRDTAPADLRDDIDLLADFSQVRDAQGFDVALVEFDENAVFDAVDRVRTFAVDECSGGDVPVPSSEPTATTAPAGDAPELTEAGPVPDIDDGGQADLAAECAEGRAAACDELFTAADLGSDAETYGATCGGRLPDDAQAGDCQAYYRQNEDGSDIDGPELGAPAAPGDDIDPAFAADARRCFDGTMAACDELARTAPEGSPAAVYGGTCGRRLGAEEAVPERCQASFGAEV